MGLNTYLDLKSVPKNIARILICYDALLQLRQKKVKATTGHYVFALDKQENFCKLPNSESVDVALNKADKCEACALGTLFISRTRIFNKLKIKDAGYEASSGEIKGSFIGQDLLAYFDKEQLALIEGCFEGGRVGYWGETLDFENRELAFRFNKKYKTSESTLIAILKNIISNDGIFMPLKNLTKKRKKVDKSKIVVKETQGE